MRNLSSKQITIVPQTIWHIPGHIARKKIILFIPGEQAFDLAICPLGTTDPTPYWMDGLGVTVAPLVFEHFGEIFIRDTDNAGDEVVNILTDIMTEPYQVT